MNVLLTSVGRRTYLVEFFKEALKPFGGKLYAVNSDTDAPGIWLADEYEKAPSIFDPAYPDFLLDLCKKKEIGILISCFDLDLPVLSKFKSRFLEQGIRVIVADEWVVEAGNDKWLMQSFLKDHGFLTRPAYLDLASFDEGINAGLVSFPVFVKPRWGMGSISVYKAQSREDLEFYYKQIKKDIERNYLRYTSENDPDNLVFIQAVLQGDEYGLDVINDLDGNYCTTVVKKKLAMRSGETDCAVTVDKAVLQDLGSKLGKITRHPGLIDVDVFLYGEKPYILEMNPRFGGGYPFSHLAGIDLPKAILNWAVGKDGEQYLQHKTGIKGAKGISILKIGSE